MKNIKSIFIVYPATDDFAEYYVPSKTMRNRMKWTPRIVGSFIESNGAKGLTYAISATNRDILDKKNVKYLKRLVLATTAIAHNYEATNMSFAGILPSVLNKRGIYTSDSTPTIRCIVDALKRFDHDLPVVLLGGNGYIGREVYKHLKKDVYIVDKDDTFPTHIKRYILLNLSQPRAIMNYIDYITEGTIVLNEVYPGPSEAEIKQLKLRTNQIYHIAGVKAECTPEFPMEYSGALPCCASVNGDIVLRQL